MLYVGLTNFLFLLGYALSKLSGKRKQFYYFVLFGLFAFSAFRYQVGCDWYGYYFQYVQSNNFDLSIYLESRDPIWWAILGWINTNGLPYPIVNVLTSAIFFVGIHIFALKQPDPLAFIVLLFPILIINMPMSGIRQGAAIGLICIAFTAFLDRRPLRFAIWVILAAGFHSSALVFLLFLPLATGSYTRKRLFLAAFLALPGAYLLGSSDAAELAASRYVGTGIDAAGAAFRLGILALSAVYFYLFLRNKWKLTWPGDYSLASIGSISMGLIFLLLLISSVIGDRLGYYLIPIQAMIFARLPFLPFGRNTSLHSAMPYFGLLLVFTVWSLFSRHFAECYIPYQTWIFGFPGGDPVGF
jgi:hypothetical protein